MLSVAVRVGIALVTWVVTGVVIGVITGDDEGYNGLVLGFMLAIGAFLISGAF
jgi:hypothetical protein